MQQKRIQEMFDEGLHYEDIQKQLDIEFGQQAFKKSTIYKYLKKAKLGLPLVEECPYTGNRLDQQLLITLQQEVDYTPYFSFRSLAYKLNSTPSLIYRYMTQQLHLVFKHTMWIPHDLEFEDKMKRKNLSLQLYQILQKCQTLGYHNIITGDQSWFLYNYAPEGAWVLEDEEAPVFSKSKICIEKMMITIIWGVYGTYIIDDLPEGAHYNSQYFIEHVLMPLEEKEKIIWPGRRERKIWLHLDNCRVHNSKVTTEEIESSIFKRTPHPPYSPDIAPSDFYLFGYIKGQLKGHSFENRNDLYEAIIEIIDRIPNEERRLIFDEWKDRCLWIYKHNGEYYHS